MTGQEWYGQAKWKAFKREDVKYAYGDDVLIRYVEMTDPRHLEDALVYIISLATFATPEVEGKAVAGTWVTRSVWYEDGRPYGNGGTLRIYHAMGLAASTGADTLIVTEDNCTYKVSHTPYWRQESIPAVSTLGTAESGITYEITGKSRDPVTGFWNFILEKREQYTTTTGIVTMEDDEFKTVTEQKFYGVRSTGTPLAYTSLVFKSGAPTATLWTVGNATAGTLIENTGLDKNDNCTVNIVQRKTVAKAVEGTVERTRTVFGDRETITLLNQATAVDAYVNVTGGVIVVRSSKRNADGKFDNTETKLTAIAGSYAVDSTRTIFGQSVSTTLKNQTEAVDAFVDVADGIITRNSSKRNDDGTYDNTQTLTTGIAGEYDVERTRTAFWEKVSIILKNQTTAVNAFVDIVDGIVTTQGSRKNDDGTFDNTKTEMTAIAGTYSVESGKDKFGQYVTTTLKNQTAAVNALVDVSGGIIYVRTSKKNDDGTFDNAETVKTAIAGTGSVDVQTTAFWMQVTTTLKNQSAPVASMVALLGGVLVTQSYRANDDGTYDNTEILRTAFSSTALIESTRTAFWEQVSITLVNQSAPVTEFVDLTGGIVTTRRSKKNDDGTWDNTETKRTAVRSVADTDRAVVETEQDLYHKQISVTLKNMETSVSEYVDVGYVGAVATAGATTSRTSKKNEDGSYDNTETIRIELEVGSAVVRAVKMTWGFRITTTNRATATAASFTTGDNGTVFENKRTAADQYDTEKTVIEKNVDLASAPVDVQKSKGGDFFETWEKTSQVVAASTFASDTSGLHSDGKVYDVVYDTDEETGIIRKTVKVRTATAATRIVLLDKSDIHAVLGSALAGRLMEHTLIITYTNAAYATWKADIAAFANSHPGFIVAWGGSGWVYRYDHQFGVGVRINDFGLWDGVLTMKATAGLEFTQTTSVS